MEILRTKKTSIIFDEPASTDAFDGAGHARSANVLADAVEKLANRNGAIGLEGRWGAGKSTVLKLAEKKLSESKKFKYSVFTFDLWAHQTDDFRRAFLEAFVSWLEESALLSHRAAEDAKSVIRDRVKKIKSDNTKNYGWLAYPIIILLPLLPLANMWLSPASLASPPVVPLGEYLQYSSVILIMLLYGCIALAIVASLLSCLKWPFTFKSPYITRPFRAPAFPLSRALTLVKQDVQKERLTQTIREEDPTTIEFYRVFRNILQQVQNCNNRIIVILDNIDRLPEPCVPAIWSEVRSLFSNTVAGEKFNNAHTTVLLPYDKVYIQNAFSAPKKETSDKALVSVIKSDIFNKTFNRIIRVSPPVATDWRNFLNQQMNFAFEPNFDEAIKFRLFKILQHHLQEANFVATPRLIIDFINELSALYEQWGEAISIESIALFVLHRDKLEENPHLHLTDVSFITPRYQDIAEVENWQTDLAALAFNVDPKKANQILLQDQISKSLTAETPKAILRLSESAGFNEILHIVLDELKLDPPNMPYLLAAAAKNLASVESLDQSIWQQFNHAVRNISSIELEKTYKLDGLFNVIGMLDNTKAQKLAIALKNILNNSAVIEIARDEFNSTEWIKAIASIFQNLSKSTSKENALEFVKLVEVPLNPRFLINVAYQCSKIEGFNLSDLSVKETSGRITAQLIQQLLNTPKEYLVTLTQLKHLLDGESTHLQLGAVAERLKEPQLEFEIRSSLLDAFYILYYSTNDEQVQKKKQVILSNICADGTLMWNAYQMFSKENYSSLANAQWLIVNSQGTNTQNMPENHPQLGGLHTAREWFQTGYGTYDEEHIKQLAQYVADNKAFSKWAGFAINEPANLNFYKSIFIEVVKQGKYSNLIIEDAIKQYPAYSKILGTEYSDKFLTKFANWDFKTFLAKHIESMPNQFLDDAYALNNSDLNEILDAVDAHLQEISTENWREAFEEEDNLIRLLLKRIEQVKITLPINHYNPALLAHMKDVLEEKIVPTEYFDNWGNLLGALKPANKQKLEKDLLLSLEQLNISQKGAEAFTALYLENIPNLPIEKHADVFFDTLFLKLIFSNEDKSKEYIRSNVSQLKKALSKTSANIKQRFNEAIESLEIPETSDWAAELRQLFGIKKKEK